MGKSIRFLYFFLIVILACGLTSATNIDSLGMFKKSDTVRITQVCSDATYINISSIAYPNSSVAVANIEMTSAGSGEYYYDFTFTETKGRYDVRGISDGCEKTFATYFEITYLGKELNESKSLMYIGFLALLILLFFLNFIGMNYLPNKNQRDEEGKLLSISYLKYFRDVLWMTGYFLLIAILFVSSNLAFAFLDEELVANTLFTLFKITFGIAPIVVIVWLVWIFVSMFHDVQFQKMLNRGIFPGGNL